MFVLVALAFLIAALPAVPANPYRVYDKSLATIDNYPSIVSVLYSPDSSNFLQICDGAIVNEKYALSSARCVQDYYRIPETLSIRVGSNYPNRGGDVYNTDSVIIHPNYNYYDYDIALIRVVITITFNTYVQRAIIASPDYSYNDNRVVYTAGYRSNYYDSPVYDQLRQVQVTTVNQNVCRQRYAGRGYTVSDNVFCANYLNTDNYPFVGGPVYDNNVVVGISLNSYPYYYPDYTRLYVRISNFNPWIYDNAVIVAK